MTDYPYIPTRWLITGNLSSDPDVFPILPGRQLLALKGIVMPPTIERKSVTNRSIRIALSDIPYWKFKVGFDFLRNSVTYNELNQLLSFFATHRGKFGTFYFSDPEDNVVGLTTLGVGDGNRTTFQLQRQVDSGTVDAFMEPVYVVSGTPTILVNNTPTSAYSISSFGSLIFNSAPPSGATIQWSGQFMFLCHFTNDELDTQQMVSLLWSSDGLEFESWIPL